MNPRLTSSLIIVSSILIFFFLILPTFDKTRMLNGAIEEREIMLKESQQIASRVSELSNEIKINKNEIKKLDQLLPKQKEISEMLVTIESIISSSGLLLSEVTLSESFGVDVGKIRANVKFTGDFDSLMTFLDLLEKNLRLIEISTIDVSSQLTGTNNAINYDIKFEARYLAP